VSDLLEELRAALHEQYAVESEVGRGGMATVFLAEDQKHGRRVAIKVLSPELSSSIDSDRFKREIQIAARLSHPHILPVFDSGEANGLLYYVMPFVEGESLRGRLRRETQLPIEDAIAITCEVADALSYAHAFGVVHRDIKPENILLHGGHAVVADFGIARVIQDAGGEKLTQTGMSVGTAAYMSPEQFSGENIDGRSDEYSLACVLYEMLVGEVPFTGPNAIVIMSRHTMELPPSIQIVRQTVPDELEGAIMHALEKVPADRFATVAQFKEALLGQGATSTYARRTRAYANQTARLTGIQKVRRRRQSLWIGAAAIVLLAGGSLAARYYWVRSHEPAVAQAGELFGALSPRRIAVLFFDDDSKDGSLAHIASGLTESLIDRLSQVTGLDVVSAEGVSPYQHSTTPSDSIARALKVGTLIRGSVDQEGDQLRISAELIDASGAPFQRESFRVPQSAVLNARDSLAGAVADLLRQRLGTEVRLREQRSATASADAWVLLQRVENLRRDAEQHIAAGDPTGGEQRLSNADSLAAAAALLDRKWPDPLLERSAIALRKARVASAPKQVRALLDTAIAFANTALTVDPRSAWALELRGTAHYERVRRELIVEQADIDRIVALAESDVRQAVAIDPRRASAWNELSIIEYGKTNVVEANAAARRAYEADAYLSATPDILARLWATSYDLEEFPDATHWCDVGRTRFQHDPRFVRCRLWLMLPPGSGARPSDAWDLVEQYTRITPKQNLPFATSEAQSLAAVVLGRAGLRDSADHVLERVRLGKDVDPEGDLFAIQAISRTLLGERDQALKALERYLTNHPDHRVLKAWWWRDLREDPRFKKLAGAEG
jgi:serine/threonine-protein kinase